MNFDIRDYIWNVFEISKEQNTSNINIALDLFIENINLGRERYKGLSFLDYDQLSKYWWNLSDKERKMQIVIFNKIMNNRFVKLREAWVMNNRNLFNILAHPSYKTIGVKRINKYRRNNKKMT